MTPPHLVPVALGFPPRQRPAEALEALAREIPRPGRFYVVTDGVLGVLSLPAVSVWTNGRVLWWRGGDGGTTSPAADAPEAARRLSREMMKPMRPTGLPALSTPGHPDPWTPFPCPCPCPWWPRRCR